MIKHNLLRFLAVVAVLGFAGSVVAKPSKSYYRAHELHSLDYRLAETLVWEICRNIGSTQEDPCKVTEANGQNLVVLGPDEAHALIVQKLAERDPAGPAAHRYEVTLVKAVPDSRKEMPSDLPGHVRTALLGVQELMRGTGFEILANGWVRTSGEGEIRLAAEDGSRYLVRVHQRSRRTSLQGTELQVGVTANQETNNPKLRDLMTTSLSLFVGETVAVGSSTTGASEAPVLFLLLTAME